eukprot:gene4675-6567_t
MSKSAYFPHSDIVNDVLPKNNDTNNNDFNDNSIKILNEIHTNNIPTSIIEFPYNRSILWDREIINYPKYVKMLNVLPLLRLEAEDVQILLFRLMNQPYDSSSLDIHAYTEEVDEINIHIPQNVTNTKHQLRLDLKNSNNNQLSHHYTKLETKQIVTIPIIRRNANDSNNLLFDQNSTKNLIQNLGKGIRVSKEYSLKSCFRFRGVSIVETNNKNIFSTIRFEVITPNCSFHAAPIKPISILATPLSKSVIQINPNQSNLLTPIIGYLTMNQIRKLVMLMENDPCVSTVPIIGLWISINDMNNNHNGGFYLDHPFVWGALVKYVFNQNINDKVYIADETFLLALLVANSVEYYEITLMPSQTKQNTTRSTAELVPLSIPDEFLCTDFTVDLTANIDARSTQLEPVLCRFKPILKLDSIIAFRGSTTSDSTIMSSDIHDSSIIDNNSNNNSFIKQAQNQQKHRENEFLAHNNNNKNKDNNNNKSLDSYQQNHRNEQISSKSIESNNITPMPRFGIPSPLNQEVPIRNSQLFLSSSVRSSKSNQLIQSQELLHNNYDENSSDKSITNHIINSKERLYEPSNGNPLSTIASSGCFSATITQAKLNDLDAVKEAMNTKVELNESQGYTFPAEIIIAQQMQIEALRNQNNSNKNSNNNDMKNSYDSSVLSSENDDNSFNHHNQSISYNRNNNIKMKHINNNITFQNQVTSNLISIPRKNYNPLDLNIPKMPSIKQFSSVTSSFEDDTFLIAEDNSNSFQSKSKQIINKNKSHNHSNVSSHNIKKQFHTTSHKSMVLNNDISSIETESILAIQAKYL